MILRVLLTAVYILVMDNLYASNCTNIDNSKPIKWYDVDYRIQFAFLRENYGEKFNKEYW